MARLEGFGFRAREIQHQLQARIQIAVMPQPSLDVFQLELAVLENVRVRLKLDERAIGLLRFAGVFLFQFADLEARLRKLAVAMAPDEKVFRQRIDRLGADAIEADAELKHVVVVFCAGIDLGDAVHDLAQGDAAPEIAHLHAVAIHTDMDLPAVAHDEFVNRVVHDLLEQDIAAVVRVRARADAPDIHARAQPDVLQRRQRLDLAFVVNLFRFFGHKNKNRVVTN